MSELANLLGDAYTIDQVGHDRRGAVNLLKSKLAADSDLRGEAESELSRLNAVVPARELGGKHGCHVSVVCRDLLTAALAGPTAE